MTTKDKSESYVGLTATEFKSRWRNHQASFKNEQRKNDTELSKYVWELKSRIENFVIKYKIIAKAKAYTNITKRCNLCTIEKFVIITKPNLAMLNKRNELVSTRRHCCINTIRYSYTTDKDSSLLLHDVQSDLPRAQQNSNSRLH